MVFKQEGERLDAARGHRLLFTVEGKTEDIEMRVARMNKKT